MIWLVSQMWPVALVSVIAGFVITWLSVTRKYNPATDPDQPQRRRMPDGESVATESRGSNSTEKNNEATTEAPRHVGIELRSPRRPRSE